MGPPLSIRGVIAVRTLVFLAGATVVVLVLLSAVRTFVLPRGVVNRLSRLVFVTSRALFNFRLRFTKTYEDRDRILAYFAPVSLLLLPAVWLMGVGIGYSAMYWALGVRPLSEATKISGS